MVTVEKEFDRWRCRAWIHAILTLSCPTVQTRYLHRSNLIHEKRCVCCDGRRQNRAHIETCGQPSPATCSETHLFVFYFRREKDFGGWSRRLKMIVRLIADWRQLRQCEWRIILSSYRSYEVIAHGTEAVQRLCPVASVTETISSAPRMSIVSTDTSPGTLAYVWCAIFTSQGWRVAKCWLSCWPCVSWWEMNRDHEIIMLIVCMRKKTVPWAPESVWGEFVQLTERFRSLFPVKQDGRTRQGK